MKESFRIAKKRCLLFDPLWRHRLGILKSIMSVYDVEFNNDDNKYYCSKY